MFKTEYLWFALPLCGLLSQLGGTFKKQYRRLGIPTLLTLCFIYAQNFDLSHFLWLRYILVWIWLFFCSTLPFTLIGDGIPKHWFNWIWVWILGLLNGLIILVINIKLFYLMFIPFIIYGVFISLSNIKYTARFFQWKFVEAMLYISVAYVVIQGLKGI